MASHIETLAAILSAAPRRPVQALVTDIYPILSDDEGPVKGRTFIQSIRSLTLIFEAPVVSGFLSIDEITQESSFIERDEIEKEVIGVMSVNSIDQIKVLIPYNEIEEEVVGDLSIDEITQLEILISYSETEKEVTGTMTIDEITQG